ncbi:hypothetical protein L2E82_22577 [Cichorium intybus]|uniref:Uncharacterized protein n=1 Tax=Cichorium intybus TaxID=13427 RepID=A0ACB9DXX7_CICIN|nr:hypothetical protein L2E82_22577 [Cichorium intybus]
MEQTHKQCELELTPRETKFCTTSLEPLLDLTHGILGMVKMKGENGDRIDVIAVCHMDMSMWDTDHVAFCVFELWLGSLPAG